MFVFVHAKSLKVINGHNAFNRIRKVYITLKNSVHVATFRFKITKFQYH